MNMSPTIAKIAKALSLAQSKFRSAPKDSTNPHFRSKYADLASYIEACRDQLASNGLALSQGVSADGAKVTVTTTLFHESGEWIQDALTLTAVKNDPQGVGSAITYGRRYGLAALLNLAADDDDGNHATGRSDARDERDYEPAPRQQQTTAPKPTPTTVPSNEPPVDLKNGCNEAVVKLKALAGEDFSRCIWHTDTMWPMRLVNLTNAIASIEKLHADLGEGRGAEAVTDVLAPFLRDKRPDVGRRALKALETAAYSVEVES